MHAVTRCSRQAVFQAPVSAIHAGRSGCRGRGPSRGRRPAGRSANSCNTELIAARNKLAPDSLPSAAEALGLTAKPALGVPPFLGSVPPSNGETDLAASEIGQGRVLASPLGMATIAAGIAARHPVRSLLVTDSASPGPDNAAASPLAQPDGEQVRSLMRAVVTRVRHPSSSRCPASP
jgi:cell division protein FtsI/penicillin-binding protein 2